jgi:adenosylcobinamide kinase/adenosylcobinamide-phosphate guanylyltransferase
MLLAFVTGPVRSGKSRFAERIALSTGFSVTYVATARPDDDDPEWRERVEQHAARRPVSWRVVETARFGAPSLEALLSLAGEHETLIVDSLGTWLADRMSARLQGRGQAEGDALLAAIAATHARVIVVGEEVGWGIVPEFPSGRVFRDVAGRLQARLATQAERSYLVVSGFALDLRTQGRPVDR